MTKQRIFTIGLIILGVTIGVYFGVKTIQSLNRMHGHGPFGKPPAANQIDSELIRDWMTVPYIANTYGVPPEAIFKSLEIPPQKENDRKSLKQLNDEFYADSPNIVLLQVKIAIKSFQKQERPPRISPDILLTPASTTMP